VAFADGISTWRHARTTGPVEQLVIFGALAWLGSLFSPFFGIAGDRFGHRALLCATCGLYALLATTMRMLAVWGLPLGLLAAGPIIARFGYPATTLP
jgi:MFS family permease